MTSLQHTLTEWHALIVCRVSDKSQLKGSGLDSQEHRCRQHAETNGYPVEAVFQETMSGGSSLLERPAIRDLFAFLDANRNDGKQYVVVFDDHKRFAREAENHLYLRRVLGERGVRIEFLNFTPDDTPEGKFTETLFAAQAQLEREQNARQTRQKSIARLEKGYWVFRAPIGYKYVNAQGGGKVLVRDEPIASAIQHALESYATGHFQSQVEVKRYLEAQPYVPKDLPDGQIRQWKIKTILENKIYAGIVEAPKWKIRARQGQHPALISLKMYQRIQERLNGKAIVHTRKDVSADFPLRGFIQCSGCGKRLSGSFAHGAYKKYAYYNCWNKKCVHYRKNIRKADLEGAFEALLKGLQPTQGLSNLVKAMFKDRWEQQAALAKQKAAELKALTTRNETKIEGLLDQIADATNPRLVTRYEKRITDLEMEQLMIAEKSAKLAQPRHSFESLYELSLQFLANPWKIWSSGRIDLQKIVLKLTFTDHLAYCKDEGLRTPQIARPFGVFQAFDDQKSCLVPLVRLERTLP